MPRLRRHGKCAAQAPHRGVVSRGSSASSDDALGHLVRRSGGLSAPGAVVVPCRREPGGRRLACPSSTWRSPATGGEAVCDASGAGRARMARGGVGTLLLLTSPVTAPCGLLGRIDMALADDTPESAIVTTVMVLIFGRGARRSCAVRMSSRCAALWPIEKMRPMRP